MTGRTDKEQVDHLTHIIDNLHEYLLLRTIELKNTRHIERQIRMAARVRGINGLDEPLSAVAACLSLTLAREFENMANALE